MSHVLVKPSNLALQGAGRASRLIPDQAGCSHMQGASACRYSASCAEERSKSTHRISSYPAEELPVRKEQNSRRVQAVLINPSPVAHRRRCSCDIPWRVFLMRVPLMRTPSHHPLSSVRLQFHPDPDCRLCLVLRVRCLLQLLRH